jgi:group I intron endonuclease
MSEVEKALPPILEIIEYHKVLGEIYKITNNINGKCYVGQTRSHRLNHGKYREFGYMGRFRDHISFAFSNKTNTCKYLTSAILKYGPENFTCEKVMVCSLDELDKYEQQYISSFSTKYPTGYNLTDGGQGKGACKGSKVNADIELVDTPEPRPASRTQTEYTRSLISSRLKQSMTDNIRENRMHLTQHQHLNTKFDKFKETQIDESDIEKYIHVVSNNRENYKYIRVVLNKTRTTFVGKHETLEQTTQRAIEFIQSIITWQRDQIAGNSLELSTTTL